MDLIKILRERIHALDAGDHTHGLRSVLQHVEVAAKHLTRGSSSAEETAYTDVIYRTNQAFEGGLKEAYRVLAAADPSRKTPFEIENYFQGKSVLRPRVLDQLSTYRTAWRNPSTHDYKLDFDENEALLAITSVCAFSIVLIDQIAYKISFDKAAAAAPPIAPPDVSKTLLESIADVLLSFQVDAATRSGAAIPRVRESEVIGGIAGLVSTRLPDVEVTLEARLSATTGERVDLLMKRGDERLLVEVKRASRSQSVRSESLAQVSRYIAVSGIKHAILYLYDDQGRVATDRDIHELTGTDARITMIAPSR